MINFNTVSEKNVYVMADGEMVRMWWDAERLWAKPIGKPPFMMLQSMGAGVRHATMREQRDFWRYLAFAVMEED